MAVPGGLIAALVGAGGAVALVLYKRKAAAAETPASETDRCAKLKDISSEAYAACRAASSLWDILDGVASQFKPTDPNAHAQANAENIALNGPTKIPLGKLPYGFGNAPNHGTVAVIRGRTLEHENGCRPFKGGPGWEKCKPGTWDMAPGAVAGYTRTNPNGVKVLCEPRHYFSGNAKDLFTVAANRAAGADGGWNLGADALGLDVPDGHKAYYVKGLPHVCAADKVLSTFDTAAGVTDNRTHVTPACVTPGTSWTSTSSGAQTPTGTRAPSGPRVGDTDSRGGIIETADRAPGGVVVHKSANPYTGDADPDR